MFKDLIKQFNFWVSIFCFILSFLSVKIKDLLLKANVEDGFTPHQTDLAG